MPVNRWLGWFLWLMAATPAQAVQVTVSAAVSLKAALDTIVKIYEGQSADRIILNYGASGALQQQITSGAPVDVFFAASSQPVEALLRQGLAIANTRRNLLSNELVLVVPSDNNRVHDFAALTKPEVKRIALGEPKIVPAGEYAEQVLSYLQLLDGIRPKLVFAHNVRQVLSYVEANNVDAGIVYATDALESKKLRVVAHAKPQWHSKIVYPVVVLKNAPQVNAAKRLVHWLATSTARDVFNKFGFLTAHDGH